MQKLRTQINSFTLIRNEYNSGFTVTRFALLLFSKVCVVVMMVMVMVVVLVEGGGGFVSDTQRNSHNKTPL